ncbi:hypothetical protein VNO78_09429 [Psophocarpus tetragonolobus]|uniref:Uncharacterized protein n=1 Tax=Psophocarpus tetragonolobus TaxID=3891 RepID=A0AAN9T6M0_PSOTE
MYIVVFSLQDGKGSVVLPCLAKENHQVGEHGGNAVGEVRKYGKDVVDFYQRKEASNGQNDWWVTQQYEKENMGNKEKENGTTRDVIGDKAALVRWTARGNDMSIQDNEIGVEETQIGDGWRQRQQEAFTSNGLDDATPNGISLSGDSRSSTTKGIWWRQRGGLQSGGEEGQEETETKGSKCL